MTHPLLDADLARWRIRRAFLIKRFESGYGSRVVVCTLDPYRIERYSRSEHSQEEIVVLTNGTTALHLDGPPVDCFEAEEVPA